jgi:DEAD/DEAH box helicase domain-containing protein
LFVSLTAHAGIKIASCKESNAVASKLGATVVLRGVLGLPVSPDDIPDSGEIEVLETVVAASAVHTLGDVAVEPDTVVNS